MPLTLPQSLSDVLDYKNILVKRRWTIALCAVLVLLFTAVRVTRETPMYYTSAQILLSHKPPSALDLQDVFQRNPWMQRQDSGGPSLALLSSRMLAERVIEKLDLLENPGVLSPPKRASLRHILASAVPASLRARIKEALSPRRSADKPQESETQDPSLPLQWMVNTYLKALKVLPTETGLVRVELIGADPAQIRKVLDTHLKEFVKLDLELKFETSDEAAEWIESRLEEARHRLEASSLALLRFTEENDLPPVSEAFTTPNDFGDLEKAQTNYRQTIQAIDLKMQILQQLLRNPNIIESLPDVRDESPMLEKLKSDFLQLTAQANSLATQYGPDHPNMVRARNQLSGMRQQIREEAQRLLRSMETQRSFLAGMLEKTEQDVNKALEDTRRRADLGIQFRALNAEVESNRKVYEEVLAKLNLIKLMGNMKDDTLMSTIRVIDQPQPALPLGGSGKIGKLGKALGMGLFLGVAIAFFLEFLDNVVRNPKDIERFTRLPFLGFIPRLRASAEAREQGVPKKGFVTVEESSSPQAETVRDVRTNLIFSFADRGSHAILFTSPTPTEGKSTVVSQLAVSIAQLGKRTLLVDTDLRKPTLHKLFGFENRSGLSDILIGESTIEESLHQTDVPNLQFLNCGTIPPNPSELLGSNSMRELVDRMKSLYEVVLFDAPPILPVVDAKVLGSLMDGICIVARSEQTKLASLNEAIHQMQERNTRILGVILNHLDLETYSAQYGYSYGYNEPQEPSPRA